MRARWIHLVGVLCCVAAPRAQVVPQPTSFAAVGPARPYTALGCEVAEFAAQVAAFADALQRLGVAPLAAHRGEGEASLAVERGEDLQGPEAYTIAPAADGLVVRAAGPIAAARAFATLLQVAEIEGDRVSWPAVEVADAPALPFRCFMVDMGRNPHSPHTLAQVVDACWFYKVAFLQLHLTDDQLCSWPSRAFPKLVDPRAGWTWHDFVALEAYGQARGVTIVPEIDVPGHSTILRRHYPDVFGATPTELATSAAATAGVERLIDELLSVFAATPYVHLGGDEAGGVPAAAQRDFMNRLARHVRATGRRAIAWEGPPLGDGHDNVATDVLLMNWNTTDVPAQAMLDAGYEVVNAAWDPLYVVDHYPRTMFTAVPVERCYAWDPCRFAHVDPGMPTFAAPHVTRSAAGIVGFCMPWWEGREQNLLSLCVPRLAAVASAAWNRDGERDFAGFEARQRRLLPRGERLTGAAFARTPFADPASQRDNLAFRAAVHVSTGASQPVFGPDRLTNGITERFDHFLGYPAAPAPLVIDVDLGAAAEVGRVVVHETAVGGSHEIYELAVSTDGERFERVGAAGEGTRGANPFVAHSFAPRRVRWVRVTTHGCHGLTFPSFSRLTEIEVFAR